jgi:RNA 2',3'-cyclic 3'-phosphodiesterase
MSDTPPGVPTRRTPKQRRERFVKERPPDPMRVDAPWRLFLAIPTPDPVRERMAHLVERLGGRGWPVRWTDPEQAHLTLHFIGEVESSQAELLRLALPTEAARHAPFALTTGKLGLFPTDRKPRVIWLGLDGDFEPMRALYGDLGAMLARYEFPVEQRPLAPHLTLGRVRDQPTRAAEMEISTTVRGWQAGEPLAMPVEEVVLYRSHLSKDGARYEPIARGRLKG